jgi:hypothetical protein
MNTETQKKSRKRTQKKTEANAATVAEQAATVAEQASAEQAATVEEQAATVEEQAATVAEQASAEQTVAAEQEVKIPKKRGRKPKGGKIVPNNLFIESNKGHEPNIIMHLKCGEADLYKNNFMYSVTYEPNVPSVETFQFENNKSNELGYSIIDYGVKERTVKNDMINNITDENIIVSKKENNIIASDNDDSRLLWNKLKELTYQLHTNSISDKKSACFWCTCDFDNPTILIPKFELNKMYHCYGCFCSPECATAYLFEEPIDTSTRFERYHLLNHIYCKIYNYEKNIKPAPNPYYTLNKYYGNLTIQEYRKLLKNERLLLVVDKPLSRVLPELHEDNDDYMFNGATISTSNKFKLRRKTKQTKTDILTETFNLK